MSSNEAEILLSLILISGGEMTFSDSMFKLNIQGIELVRKAAAAPRGNSGFAEDLLQDEYAKIYIQQVNSHHWRKLWINWQSTEQTVRIEKLPIAEAKVIDFWHGKELSVNQNAVLPGKSCLLIDICSNPAAEQ